jgi:hypothetical protein
VYSKIRDFDFSLEKKSSTYGPVASAVANNKVKNITVQVENKKINLTLLYLDRYVTVENKGPGFWVNSVSLGEIFDDQPDSILDRYTPKNLSKEIFESDGITGTVNYPSDQYRSVTEKNLVVDDGFLICGLKHEL